MLSFKLVEKRSKGYVARFLRCSWPFVAEPNDDSQALETIRNKKEWAAEVVYGDTDSLFVYLPGRSKEEAFRIGNEMAEVITSQNPRPIKLKFEKVYLLLSCRNLHPRLISIHL